MNPAKLISFSMENRCQTSCSQPSILQLPIFTSMVCNNKYLGERKGALACKEVGFGATFVIERLSVGISRESPELFASGNCRVKLLESFGACNRISSLSALLYRIAHLQ